MTLAHCEEEVRRSESIITDGVYEMMNIAAYVHFASKPKNGGFDSDEAKGIWEKLCSASGAIVDHLGPSPKLARRVAVRVKDLVIVRDQQERLRILVDAHAVSRTLEPIQGQLANQSGQQPCNNS